MKYWNTNSQFLGGFFFHQGNGPNSYFCFLMLLCYIKCWEIWNQVWLYISHKKPTLHVDALLPGKNKIIAWGCLKAVYFFLILQQNIISSSSCASGVRTKELKSTVSNFKSPILSHSWTLHPFLLLFRVLWCQRFWHTDQQRSKTRGCKECVLENMQTWLAMHEASNAIKNYSVWFWKVHGRVHFLCRVLKAKVFKHVKKGKCNHWGILTRKIAGFLGMSNSPASALFVDPMLRFFFSSWTFILARTKTLLSIISDASWRILTATLSSSSCFLLMPTKY